LEGSRIIFYSENTIESSFKFVFKGFVVSKKFWLLVCVGVSVLVHNFSNFYSLMETIRTYIGVDVGTTSARAAIFDQKGRNSKTDKLHSFTQNEFFPLSNSKKYFEKTIPLFLLHNKQFKILFWRHFEQLFCKDFSFVMKWII
jgi:hypothetical protein